MAKLMAFRIGGNSASISAQRRLGEATSSLSETYLRLSTGQRINKASDDAAGLAIASELNVKTKIYTQGIRNANDGISLLNIAETALGNLTSIVSRIRELSEQAANGSYSSKQRASLDAEAQALSKEFTRITQSTSFNGSNLFNGSLNSGVNLQLGAGNSESIGISVGGAIGTGTFGNSTNYATEGTYSNSIKFGDLNGDGIMDLITAGLDSSSGKVTVRLGLGGGQFGSATTYTSELLRSQSVHVVDLNGDGKLDLVSAGAGGSSGQMTVRLGAGDGTFGAAVRYTTELNYSNNMAVGDINNDGIVDVVTTGLGGGSGKTSIFLGVGDGTFTKFATYTAELNNSFNITLGDINNDGNLDIFSSGYDAVSGKLTVRLGNGDGTFSASTSITAANGFETPQLADLNNDGNLDYVVVGANSGGKATVALGNGNGTFAPSTVYTADGSVSYGLQLADFNGDGNIDMMTAGGNGSDGTITLRLGNGSGGFSSATVYTTENQESYFLAVGDLNGDGVLDFATAGTAGSSGQATVRLSNTKEGLGALQSFSLKSRPDALSSMGMLDSSLNNLIRQRGTIGASLSRVGIAISNLQSAADNFRAAESRIKDLDVATEAASLIRTQILQKAATSVLAQANQDSAIVLKLLGTKD